jgi:hypothetical protein
MCYLEGYERRQKAEHQRFFMLVNFITGLLDFHFYVFKIAWFKALLLSVVRK